MCFFAAKHSGTGLGELYPIHTCSSLFVRLMIVIHYIAERAPARTLDRTPQAWEGAACSGDEDCAFFKFAHG